MPAEKVEEFFMYYEQFYRRARRDSELHHDDGVAIILDWDGFTLSEYASGPGDHHWS